jgi:hypothetical protein
MTDLTVNTRAQVLAATIRWFAVTSGAGHRRRAIA